MYQYLAFAIFAPRRYGPRTAVAEALELIIGPYGALLMILAAALSCWLLVYPPRGAVRFPACALAVLALLLLAVRTAIRMLCAGGGLSFDAAIASLLGGALIGVPLLLIGAVLGQLCATSITRALDGDLPASQRAPLTGPLTILTGGAFLCFGFAPGLGILAAVCVGLTIGALEDEALSSPQRFLRYLRRSLTAALIGALLLADATSSVGSWFGGL